MITANFATVSGVRTRYYDVGQGHPVVLIHGGEPGRSAAADVWTRNLEALGARFRVLAPDRLFQGYTDNGPLGDFTISAICDHMGHFLDHLDIRSATLVGQSRGAFVATHLAMKNPGLAQRLVLVNSGSMSPAYGAEHPFFEDIIKDDPGDYRHDAELMSYTTRHITDDWVRATTDMLNQEKNVQARKVFQEQKASYYSEFDSRKEETLQWLRDGGLRVPAMVFWGIGDRLVDLEEGIAIFNLVKTASERARMYIFDHCGHWCFREYPKEFNAALTTFVDAT